MTLHLAYAVPPPSAWPLGPQLGAARNRLGAALGLEPYYRRGRLPGLPRPLGAPGSITCRLSRFLAARTDLRLYDLRERGRIELGPDDLLLGHPWPDPDTIVQQTLRGEAACRLKALIFPIHHALPQINRFTLELLDRADLVFGVMGTYWFDTLGGSIFAPWRQKIVRLDMALDVAEYPLLKHRFNPPGKRGILYIGANRPEKGCDVLDRTLARMPGVRRGWIGPGPELPHVPRLAGPTLLTPRRVAALCRDFDVFVNTSVSDANPTTILESMAWGFPVACTPQSGYYNMPTLFPLSTTDIDANVGVLTQLQDMPGEELARTAAANRRLVETSYTWDRFCDTVWQGLAPHLA